MADYISREAAISEILSEPADVHYPSWYAEKLEDIPAVDVRPVVHGEWMCEEPNGANNFKGCYWCDKCHQPISHKKNFCPNCGADMREEVPTDD